MCNGGCRVVIVPVGYEELSPRPNASFSGGRRPSVASDS